MTYQHPLTDEICDQIQDSVHPCDPENMRAAADWQLEQVIEWLEVNLIKHGFHEGYAYLYKDLKKAMRPTNTLNPVREEDN